MIPCECVPAMFMPNMLYQAYELQRQFAEPVRLWANALESVSIARDWSHISHCTAMPI